LSSESEPETSGRRRFLRKAVGLTAAGGIASLLYGGVSQKPLVELAQAASGGNMIIDAANDGESGTTSLSSSANPTLLGINTGSGAAIQGTSSVGTGVLGTTADGYGISGVTSGSGVGVQGWAIAESGVGVQGIANAPNTAGVRGIATASSSNMYYEAGGAGRYTAGVEGYAFSGSGPVQGVYGHSDSPEGCGVWGVATATSGEGCGVAGYSESPDGAGVWGNHWATAGWAAGVAGKTDSPEGNGVWGRNFATSGVDAGMTPHGVYGQVDANGGTWTDGPWPRGVEGYAAGSSGAGSGVCGHTDLPDGDGVSGMAPNSGVYGEAALPTGRGIWGLASATSADPGLRPTGVYGEAYANGGTFEGGGPFPAGVEGYASGASGLTTGVYGHVVSPDGTGVGGVSEASSGWGAGVAGFSYSLNGYGVWGEATATSGQACGVGGQSNSWGAGVYGRGGVGVVGQASDWPGAIAIVAQAASNQTASLQEWWRADYTPLAVVDKDGQLGVGTGVPGFKIHVLGLVDPTALAFDSYGIVASNIIGRRARGTVDTPTAIQTDDALLVLNGRGYGDTGFSNASRTAIRLLAAENWTDAAQGAYIRFETTQAGGTNKTEKMRITDAGDIIPPSDISGNIGTASNRWALVRAKTITPGDLTFENGYRLTEDPDSGMLLVNQNGERIARFDEQGNLHIKGDIIKDL